MNVLNFGMFREAYLNLVKQGIVKESSDKEIFIHYIQAEMDYPNLKKHWDEEKVYKYFSGSDDQEEEDQ